MQQCLDLGFETAAKVELAAGQDAIRFLYSRREAELIHSHLRAPLSACFSSDRNTRKRTWKLWFLHVLCRPIVKFLYLYIACRRFMDGCPGYVYCRLQALYEQMIRIKSLAAEPKDLQGEIDRT